MNMRIDEVTDVDIVLVPDLVAGNILAKDLAYLAGAVLAGVVLGASVPIVLTSRSDPPAARLASFSVAALMHHSPGTTTFHNKLTMEE